MYKVHIHQSGQVTDTFVVGNMSDAYIITDKYAPPKSGNDYVINEIVSVVAQSINGVELASEDLNREFPSTWAVTKQVQNLEERVPKLQTDMLRVWHSADDEESQEVEKLMGERIKRRGLKRRKRKGKPKDEKPKDEVKPVKPVKPEPKEGKPKQAPKQVKPKQEPEEVKTKPVKQEAEPNQGKPKQAPKQVKPKQEPKRVKPKAENERVTQGDKSNQGKSELRRNN